MLTLTVNSVGYSFPSTGDQPPWGDGITNWASAVTTGMLQKAGGAFTLTADANFGASFGLVSAYFTSRTANAASAGAFRLAKTDVINWRNNANSGNLSLTINSSDVLTFNGNAVITTTGVVAASKALVSDGSGNIISHASTTATQIGYLATAGSNIHGDTDVATLTNKTLTSPTLNSPTINTPTLVGSGGTLTIPAGPDTLIGRATTDTLTNKTIDAGSNTISSLSASNFVAQTKNKVLAGPTSGSNATPTFRSLVAADFSAPTIQKFTSTGSTAGYVFTISTTTTCGVGDTYTNNAQTFTAVSALSAQSGQVLWMTGTGAPGASGTLTRATGSGTASVTFTSQVTYATYTTPSSPAPLYLKVRVVGGGGGGSGSGTASSSSNGGTGGNSLFGTALLFANGATGGTFNGNGGTGGTASLGSGPIGLAIQGGSGQGNYFSTPSTVSMGGGNGAASPFGGAGGGGSVNGTATGVAAIANSGSGGGGGAEVALSSGVAGSGGGAGGFVGAIITSPTATYGYVVGTNGTAGGAGTSGAAGGAGASGIIIVEEHYQ